MWCWAAAARALPRRPPAAVARGMITSQVRPAGLGEACPFEAEHLVAVVAEHHGARDLLGHGRAAQDLDHRIADEAHGVALGVELDLIGLALDALARYVAPWLKLTGLPVPLASAWWKPSAVMRRSTLSARNCSVP